MASIEIEVHCECGNLLDSEELKGAIVVSPCEKCLEAAKEEGRNDGYNERDMEEKDD